MQSPCGRMSVGLLRSFGICVALFSGLATQAQAGTGDLLVAPTRLVLNGESGGEVNLTNTGDDISTYRISLVLRRMDEQGRINAVDETTATGPEAAALEMITYAPRKVVLGPHENQTVRIGVRLPPGLPDGEYRAHMLFRAVPKVEAAENEAGDAGGGLKISLTPIYGVTIPVIVRHGDLSATARLEKANVVQTENGPALSFDLVREGNRAIYGDIDVMHANSNTPVFSSKGLAAYTEVGRRSVMLQLNPQQAQAMQSGLIVRYTERAGDKPLVSETTLKIDP